MNRVLTVLVLLVVAAVLAGGAVLAIHAHASPSPPATTTTSTRHIGPDAGVTPQMVEDEGTVGTGCSDVDPYISYVSSVPADNRIAVFALGTAVPTVQIKAMANVHEHIYQHVSADAGNLAPAYTTWDQGGSDARIVNVLSDIRADCEDIGYPTS